MKNFKCSIVATLVPILFSSVAHSTCVIENSDKSITKSKGDALYRLFAQIPRCPMRAQDLKAQLVGGGATVEPAMVGSRGFNNPDMGSFSFFETVSGHLNDIGTDVAKGEFFFGHFTVATDDHQLILDQAPDAGKLLVELIAWDKTKRLFNFYEMIGQGRSAQWFYRGDSVDILRDNTFVYRDVPPGQIKFGKTLRCAGCHSSGGPIMKELAFPHNDWWTVDRPLQFGSNLPSKEVNTWLRQVIDANQFAQNVKSGIQELEVSPSYKNAKEALSLQERLRPLFCENEINLESSPMPFDSLMPVQIPSGFFLNPRLAQPNVTLDDSIYLKFLKDNSMHFPETNMADADHPWLTPVKAYSDLLAIQTMIDDSVVDEAFVVNILSFDVINPIFSKDRCSLLKLLPGSGPKWREQFVQNLQASDISSAQELAKSLSDPTAAKNLLEQTNGLASILEKTPLTNQRFQKLIEVRKAVFESEISQNPRGQILEPGFRVIFPEPDNNQNH